jgi:hypothetical protein
MTPLHLNSCAVAVGRKRLFYGATQFLPANCRIKTHTHICTYTHIYIHKHIFIHTYKHTHKYTYIHTYTRIYIHTNTHKHIIHMTAIQRGVRIFTLFHRPVLYSWRNKTLILSHRILPYCCGVMHNMMDARLFLQLHFVIIRGHSAYRTQKLQAGKRGVRGVTYSYQQRFICI